MINNFRFPINPWAKGGFIGGYLHERKRVHEEEKFKIIEYTSLGTFLVYKGVSEVNVISIQI